MRMFSKPGGAKIEFCLGICLAAGACRVFDTRTTFVRSDLEFEVLTTANADFVLFCPSEARS